MIQFYIDRFNDSVKDTAQPTETEIILSTLEESRDLANKLQT